MRKTGMKRLAAGMLAAALALLGTFPAMAATTKKITSITLNFEADIRPGTDFGDETVEIEPTGDKFSVDGYVVKNEGFEWEEDSVPKLEITLVASDGYRFSSIKQDKLRLKGAGAKYVSGYLKDSSQTIIMTVELDSLAKSLSPIENVNLSAEGVASWTPVGTAGAYELRVYRDGKAVGSSVTTTYTSYNCTDKMTKSANYYVRVRPINKTDAEIKGEWAESGNLYVDSGKAAYFKANPVANPEGEFPHGSWKQAEDGRWWYDNGDGTYPKSCWQEVSGKWYCFDEAGYMRTGWIEWEGKWYFCSESGEMLKDCITEDNYLLGADGAMINQDPMP